MKSIKLAVLLALALLITLLAACSGGAMKAASGSYEGQYHKLVGDDIKEKGSFSLVLYADGTGIHSRDGSEFEVTWTLQGETFTMKEAFLGVTIAYTGTLQEDVLDIFNGDPGKASTGEYVYKKK